MGNTLEAVVKVVLPVFNRKKLLPRAVQSVLKQDYPFHLVIVDDGSTDGSLENGLYQHKSITVMRLDENRGVSAARNKGIEWEFESYDWIAFLDSDDEWLPHKLKKQMEWIAKHPSFRIMQCDDQWIRDGKRVNPWKKHEKLSGEIFIPSLQRCLVTPSAVLVHKSIFEEFGLFDESLRVCEDYDMWLRVSKIEPFGLLREKLSVRYQGHGDQISLTTPIMDQYRVKSLNKLLEDTELPSFLREPVMKQYNRLCQIIAKGARKRGNEERANYYESLIKSSCSE